VDNNGAFTTIDVPGATFTAAFGINPNGTIVGSYADSSGHGHGFVDNNGAFTTIDVPGATLTAAFGINPNGTIVGSYSPPGTVDLRGFEASVSAATSTVSMSDLLASMPNQASMSDLLPGAPGIGPLSAQTMSGSGLLEQATGSQFAGLASPMSADPTMQLLMSGNG
jgi:hypothetical protein